MGEVMKSIALLLGALLALAAPTDVPAQDGPALQRMAGATGWLNSPQLGAAELQGKVVLVDFWTYTCINWMRTLPYVRAWAEKYTDQGLVVIGVHTPEFEFEKQLDNVRRSLHDLRVPYPVAIDSDYAVWRAFGNSAWPAIYLIDARGRVRYSHLGEGAYERTERMIQQLLTEAGRPANGHDLVAAAGRGVEAAADWANLRSPETYLGAQRTENFASPGGVVVGKPHMYAAPARLALNRWALAGDWTVQNQVITLNKPMGRIVYRFHARDVHLVMGPAAGEGAVRFRVLIDGKPPGDAHGVDIDEQGNGTVTWQRMYQLVRQQKPVVDRQFEIEFVHPGVEAFAFTFG
jgi:thiol-disulfide isomerase/thioredoxin